MERLEKILKQLESSDEDEQLLKLIGLDVEKMKQMSNSDYTPVISERLFEVFDQYGWSNVKKLAKEKHQEAYIEILKLSDSDEDIEELKEVISNWQNYPLDIFDIRDLIYRINDLDFLEGLLEDKTLDRFIRSAIVTNIVSRDLVKGKEVLKKVEEPCSVTITVETIDKIEDKELTQLLIDNRKQYAIGFETQNILLGKLYTQDPELAKKYIGDILENPTKQCILKSKIWQYLQGLLSKIAEVDEKYASELAVQMMDKIESYNAKIENAYMFIEHIDDSEKLKEYLANYKKLNLDIVDVKNLLERLSKTDQLGAVEQAKKIINSLEPEKIGLKIMCIVACQNVEFIKECIENDKKYDLDISQKCALLAQIDDHRYIINKINEWNINPSELYILLSSANNENLYLHCAKNADALGVNTLKIYQMMTEKFSRAVLIKQLKSADKNGLGSAFKELALSSLIKIEDDNINGFIKKYIKNYKTNKLDENLIVRVLSENFKSELIDTYFDVKDSSIKENELKLLLYSTDERRREQVLDLIFSGKIQLNRETKSIATLVAYTIQDREERNAALKRLRVNNPEPKSKVMIPPEMTVGIEIESIGPMSKQIQDLRPLILGDWDAKKDGSLGDAQGMPGVEVTSPILNGDDSEINNKIYYVSNLLINEGQSVNSTCGGHIHIGADYFKDYESYQNLVDLWVNCEQIFYIISNQVGEVPRANISDYAKPISKSFERVVEKGFVDLTKVENLKEIEGQLNLASKRCNGINFNNLSNFDKHTIEFRIPNGTINPDTWIENINLFGNLLKKCKEITEIRKKDKDALTPDEKQQLGTFNSLVFGDLSIDDRAKLLIDYIIPESQRYEFHKRYFVNSKLLNLHKDVKDFLSSETFEKPVDLMDLKDELFKQEGRIVGKEFAISSTIINHDLQPVIQTKKGATHEHQ